MYTTFPLHILRHTQIGLVTPLMLGIQDFGMDHARLDLDDKNPRVENNQNLAKYDIGK